MISKNEKLENYENDILIKLMSLIKNIGLENEFSLGQSKEQCVCLNKKDNMWEVYLVERGIAFDKSTYEELFDACIEVLRQLSDSNEMFNEQKELFSKATQLILQKNNESNKEKNNMSIDRVEILSTAEILYRNDLVKKLEIDPNSEYGMKTLNEYLEQERISDILSAKRNLKNNNHGEFIKQSEIRIEAERIKNERLEPYIKKAIKKHQEQDSSVLEKTYKKYIGIIKIYTDYMSGTQIKLLSKTYDDKKLLNIWFNMYPNSEHLLLENTQELDEMFEIFKDMTPITEEEQKLMEITKVLYENLMNDSDNEGCKTESNNKEKTKKLTSSNNTGNQ